MRHSRDRGRLKTFSVAACAAVVVMVTARRASADPVDVSFALSWKARGEACVVGAELRDAVEQRLRRKPFTDPAHADILIDAEESADGSDRFGARVTERDRRGVVRGVRVLAPQSCASLRRAATLIVTLIIDPHLSAKPPDERAAEPPAPEPELPLVEPPPAPSLPALRAPRQLPPVMEAQKPRALHLSLGLGAGTSFGVLPSASATVSVIARLEPEGSRWSFDWSGGYSLPQRLRDGPVRGDFAAVEQRVRACFGFARWPSQRKLDLCGGAFLGAILPETVGIRRGSDHWRMLVGPTAALGFEQRAGAIGARVELGLTFSFRQYDFSYFDVANERKGFYSTNALFFFIALSGFGRIS